MSEARRAIISADSHVIEPLAIWDGLIPVEWWGNSAEKFSRHPGGSVSAARIDEMAADGVSAEVLYPSLAMQLFTVEDPIHQAKCFRRYNEWLAEYCSVAPERLVGIGLVPAYDMHVAVAESQWCRDQGLRGVQVWQTPPAHLPFNGRHYEPLWEVCSDLGLPVSLHILTGFDYGKAGLAHPDILSSGELLFKLGINEKLLAVTNSLTELIVSGVMDRHRGLKIVLVENEVGWLPFFVDQLDYYYEHYAETSPVRLERLPSAAFREQIAATFFRDPYAAFVATCFDGHNIMWSSDYPHGNSTWPHSQQVVADRLESLPEEVVHRLVWGNVSELFNLDVAMVR
jgi:predicted TIM-barrel fold metal-dependent hydrolase